MALGWEIIPLQPVLDDGACACGTKCGRAGKHPLLRWRQSGGSTDPGFIKATWGRHPERGVAILTGARSGLFVLDVDPEHGGNESLVTLIDRHGPLPKTLIARTGGGGRHLYFRHPGIPVGQTAGALGPGLDTRCDGGLVVAPPSVHRSGENYRWQNFGTPLAGVPTWIIEALTPKLSSRTVSTRPLGAIRSGDAYGRAVLRDEIAHIGMAIEGARNAALNLASFKIGQLIDRCGLDIIEVADALITAARGAGLTEAEARATAMSGLAAGWNRPRV